MDGPRRAGASRGEPRPAEGAAGHGRLPLQAVLPEELAAACSIDLADARRLVALVHRTGALPDRAPATIRRAALEAVRARGAVPSLDVLGRRASAVDLFVKYALGLADGRSIEAVRIPLERAGRFSACVSSQVGCALACAFCATGRMGLVRNLETWEIVEQVRIIRADLAREAPGARVHGIVFQGMGEPLANADRVIQAIRVLSEPSAGAIDMRNVTVCTAGLPSGIRRLWREVPAARLALSLGAVRPGRRRTLMPIDAAHPLEEVLEAAGEHARATRHAPLFAYTLLAGDNDGLDDAHALADLAIRFRDAHGVRPRISLIPFNGFDGSPFARTADARLAAFRDVLHARGAGSTLRYSGGGDVDAACGQLVAPTLRAAARGESARVGQVDSAPSAR